MGGGSWRSLLIDHVSCMKYPKKITLCDTNTLILPTIVIIIDKLFLPVSRKKKEIEWDYQSKKTPCGGLATF